MKSNRTIEITVSPIGDITINALGFKGADCEKATQFLEEALGKIGARERKPEYLLGGTAVRQQRIQS